MKLQGKQSTDRRLLRKRAFIRAGLATGGGLAAGMIPVLVGAPFHGLIPLAAGLCLSWQALHLPEDVPILVYHSVSPDAAWLPWSRNTSIRPEVLDIHLRTLRRHGWTIVSTAELIAARQTGASLPRRAVVLQFDDAYLDNYLFAVPILRRHGAPATIFASVDFIAPGNTTRDDAASQGPSAWQGYMNAAELRALDADPLFAIEAHGTDHARIPVSGQSLGRVGPDWKRHAPLAWAVDASNKSDWYRAGNPPPSLSSDALLLESDSALAGRWWRNGMIECEAAFRVRILAMLERAYRELAVILNRAPVVLAWPYDRCDPVGIEVAHQVGFAAVTGGRGDNRPHRACYSAPVILSRVHLQDRAFGGGPLWLEALALRARVNAAAGWLVWHLVSAIATRLRRRRMGWSGYGGLSS